MFGWKGEVEGKEAGRPGTKHENEDSTEKQKFIKLVLNPFSYSRK